MYPVFLGPVWFAILIAAYLYLNRSDLKRLSSARVRRVDLAPRLLIGITALFVILKLALVPGFLGCVVRCRFAGFGLGGTNLQPVKTEYRVTDPNYLEKHYQRQSIFGCSLHVPRDLRHLAARIDRSSSGLILLLEGKYDVAGVVRFTLWSNNSIVNTASRFGFRDPYEFEKIVHRPSWRAMDLWMKEAAVNFVPEKIEDGKSPHWRGFVQINEEYGLRIRSSLYDIDNENSLDIRIVFQHGPPALGHAKDVLAALEFETDKKDASVYLNEGKTSLSNGEYVDALFDFLNAHYVDRLNPEPAYYFARSLLEGPPEAVIWGRLHTAEEFLKYALELDSTYHEAEELLATVEKEMEDLRGR
jgi:tetratricopeptide (TPR) repeat protein